MSSAQGGDGGWPDRLIEGVPEHDFERFVVGTSSGTSGTENRPGLHTLSLWGPRPAGSRMPRGRRRQEYLRRWEALLRTLVDVREQPRFGAALCALAES